MSNNKKISGMGFHHINVKVSDFEKSVSFYTEALGMTPSYAWSEGDLKIQMLDIGDGGILEILSGGSDAESDEGKWNHFAFKVDDVEAAYASAIAGGAESMTPPTVLALNSTPEKITLKIAFVYGPDREHIEFFRIV